MRGPAAVVQVRIHVGETERDDTVLFVVLLASSHRMQDALEVALLVDLRRIAVGLASDLGRGENEGEGEACVQLSDFPGGGRCGGEGY